MNYHDYTGIDTEANKRRVFNRIDIGGPDECWFLCSRPESGGNTVMVIGEERFVLSHLVFFFTHGRPVELRHVISRTCHDPNCFNPAHLVEVKHSDACACGHQRRRDMIKKFNDWKGPVEKV
jgi:hypothetical protein